MFCSVFKLIFPLLFRHHTSTAIEGGSASSTISSKALGMMIIRSWINVGLEEGVPAPVFMVMSVQ